MLQGTQPPPLLSARNRAPKGYQYDSTPVDEQCASPVTPFLRKAPSLKDNHVFCCGLTSYFDPCPSAIFSGSVFLVSLT